jgi:[acyl-carrier-protein] S-malonyltransferase
MGKGLCEQFPLARKVFAEAEDALGFALSQLCFTGPEAELKLTENTQPAILTASVAALRVLEAETALRPALSPGSLGEYSAGGDRLALCRRRESRASAVADAQAVPAGQRRDMVILNEMDGATLCADASQD